MRCIDTVKHSSTRPPRCPAIQLLETVSESTSPAQVPNSLPTRSNTFKMYASEHDEAVDIVKAAFGKEGPLHHWNLIGLNEEVERLRVEVEQKAQQFVLADEDDDGLLWRDSGVWGILDKIVAMRSALFVSSARECGKVRYVRHSPSRFTSLTLLNGTAPLLSRLWTTEQKSQAISVLEM